MPKCFVEPPAAKAAVCKFLLINETYAKLWVSIFLFKVSLFNVIVVTVKISCYFKILSNSISYLVVSINSLSKQCLEIEIFREFIISLS